jgi:hypothetical protein
MLNGDSRPHPISSQCDMTRWRRRRAAQLVQRIRYGHRPTRLTRPSPQSWGYCQSPAIEAPAPTSRRSCRVLNSFSVARGGAPYFLLCWWDMVRVTTTSQIAAAPRSRLSRHPLSTLALWRRSAPPRWSSAGVTATGVDAGVGSDETVIGAVTARAMMPNQGPEPRVEQCKGLAQTN